MKSLLTIACILFLSVCFGQTKTECDAEYNLTIPYQPATIQLIRDTTFFLPANVNSVGKITYVKTQPGLYKIRISGPGQSAVIKDSVYVREGQRLVLNIKKDGPCLYDHPAGYIPICPKNHKDKIIPIVYGLVATRGDEFIKNKADMKVKYAGCSVSDCDPQYYCKEHGIEF